MCSTGNQTESHIELESTHKLISTKTCNTGAHFDSIANAHAFLNIQDKSIHQGLTYVGC